MDLLRLLVVISAVFALLVLTIHYLRARRWGIKPVYAKIQGKPRQALIYTFTAGMMPWSKESASKHLPTFIAGIIFHLAVAAAVVTLVAAIFAWTLPSLLKPVLLATLFSGIACGLGLFVKRMVVGYLRAISVPDDFVASLLVNLFMINAVVNLIAGVSTVFFLTAIVLFAYIPFGKIRHCWFFFCSRLLFAEFYGYRGALPPAQQVHHD